MSILTFIDSIFRKYRFNSPARKGGALPDIQDDRDFKAGNLSFQSYPETCDLRPWVKEVKSQGKYNSCVAHSICSSIESQLFKKNPKAFIPFSERFVYFHGRKEGNCFPDDGGMYTREAIKSVMKYGIAPEFTCGYYSAGINDEPSSVSKIVAGFYKNVIKEYRRLQTVDDIKSYIGNLGVYVNLTVPLYSFWAKVGKDGIVPMPGNDRVTGYHSILVVGYTKTHLICLNSWNLTWGDGGYCYLPIDYPMEDKWAILLN